MSNFSALGQPGTLVQHVSHSRRHMIEKGCSTHNCASLYCDGVGAFRDLTKEISMGLTYDRGAGLL